MSRELDASRTIGLTDGQVLRVETGTVLVFVVPDGGRRIPVLTCRGPGLVAGIAVPGGRLLVAGMPGTRVAPGTDPGESARAEMTMAVESALVGAAQSRETETESQVLQAHHDERLVDDSLLGLAAVVPGRKPPLLGGAELPHDVAVVDFVARQIGLHPDPLALRRAVTDAAVSGREPLTALAAAAGAAIRRVELAPDWWRREGPPLLVHRPEEPQADTAAAVWRRGGYRLWQPDGGLGDVVAADAAAQWSRSAVLLEPLLDANKTARLSDLARLGLRGSNNSIALVVGLTVVVGLLAAVIPVVAGALTQSVSSQTSSTLLVVGFALVALAAGDLLLRAVRSFALLRIRGRAVSVTATAVWDRLLRLPMSWHTRRTVASRMTDANAVDTASLTAPDPVITALLDVAAVGGAIVGVFTTSWPLAFALIGFLIVRGVVEVILVRRSARLTAAVLDATTQSQAVTLDLITGVNRLRVSGASARAFALWADSQARTTEVEVRRRRLSVVQQMTGAFWPTVGLAILLVVTAAAGADVGQLVTAQTALTAATGALAAAVASIGAGLSARAVLRRAEEVLQSEPESRTGQEVAELGGSVDVRDLVFRYRDDMPAVLDGVSLSVPAGSHVAIVGPSGCGKSTLLRLLLGLEDPGSGIVSYDGRDLSGLDRSSVRRQIGTVMQGSQLMPGSIRENVDLGRGLTTDEVWQALADAAVAEEIRDMPMGLSTVVIEGSGAVSGGQRQRILLARALAGRPRILILDEATSALDNVSQAAVVASLDRLAITRLVVAHRLSTIEQADRVVMLADGRVAAQGTYEQLMDEDGPFRDLVQRQQI